MPKLNEHQLVNWTKCHIYDPVEMAAEYKAAVSTIRWALLQLTEGKIVEKLFLIQKFETELGKHTKGLEKDKAYWNAIRKGRRFISKFIVLFRKYDVIHPIQSYSYHVGGQVVEGEYALIQKKTETEVPLVLNIVYNRPITFQLPSLLPSLRWLNSKNDYMNTGIYNFCLFRGDDWKTKDINEPLVRTWIHGIIREINSGYNYPTSGAHCGTCKSKTCLKDYYVGQNDNRW